MGNWQLEVFRFGLYVFMPVLAFYGFHQVDLFKDDLLRFQRRLHTSETHKNEAMVRECVSQLQRSKEEEFKRQLEKFNAK